MKDEIELKVSPSYAKQSYTQLVECDLFNGSRSSYLPKPQNYVELRTTSGNLFGYLYKGIGFKEWRNLDHNRIPEISVSGWRYSDKP